MKIGIAGAGIVGRLLAYRLQQAGHAITLFDQDEPRSCSMTAAGMLTPITELEKNAPLIYSMGLLAIERDWPELLSSLPGHYFKQAGSLVLAHPRDQVELTRFVRVIETKLTILKKSPVINSLDQQGILALEPEITKFTTGYYFPQEGQIDAQSLMLSLGRQLETMNWCKGYVQTVTPHQVVINNQKYSFDQVIDSRGLGAKSIYKEIRAVRGELIWLHAPEVTIHRPIRLLHPRYSIYLVPRENHHYLIGASEIESHDMSPISVRTTLELLTAAYSIHPALAEARIIDTATQCRPTLTDHLPKIKYADGFIAINGLYRHGYLIAPTLVTEVMKWLESSSRDLQFPTLWEEHRFTQNNREECHYDYH